MKKSIALTIASLLAMPSAYAVSCKSFSTQAEAQAYFKAHHAKKLDRDHDGIACEHLAGGGGKSHRTKSTKKHVTKTRATKSSANVSEGSNPFK